VSLKTGARSDAADQVLVVCCPMGVRRRVKRKEGARWGSWGAIRCAEKGTKRTERAHRAERCPKRCSCTHLESLYDYERILSENPCSQIMHSLFLNYTYSPQPNSKKTVVLNRTGILVSKFSEILNRTESKIESSTEVHLNWQILNRSASVSSTNRIECPAGAFPSAQYCRGPSNAGNDTDVQLLQINARPPAEQPLPEGALLRRSVPDGALEPRCFAVGARSRLHGPRGFLLHVELR